MPLTHVATSALSPSERGAFRTDGYVVVRQLAPAEVCQAMRELTLRHLDEPRSPVEYEADTHYPGAPTSRHAPGGRTIRRLLQAYARDPLFRNWVESPSIGNRLRQLLGGPIALSQAHHNCVMTKQPAFSSVTGWHQDMRYWAFERPELVSVWLALGPERVDNGCLLVIPGSHNASFARDQYDDALFFRTDRDANREVLAQQVAVELEPGDVLFFHCRLLHAAGRNTTPSAKLAAVFTFHRQDNHALPGTRSASIPSVSLDSAERVT